MSIAVLFDCSGDTLKQYEDAFAMSPELADQPSRSFHACVSSDSGFLVIDIWESAEAFAQFGAVLGPTLEKVSLHPVPDVREVHRIINRAAAHV